MRPRTFLGAATIVTAAAALAWLWDAQPIPSLPTGGAVAAPTPATTSPPGAGLATLPPTPPPAPSLASVPAGPAGLPGYPGVLATPWPGQQSNGVIPFRDGKGFTVAPPVYPPATVPQAAPSCPWSATDAVWAEQAMTADSSADLETYEILSSGQGYQYGWNESGATIALYQQAASHWATIAQDVWVACFPDSFAAAFPWDGPPPPATDPTAAQLTQAEAWLAAGAASHPGSDPWSVAWRDTYQYIASMFERA